MKTQSRKGSPHHELPYVKSDFQISQLHDARDTVNPTKYPSFFPLPASGCTPQSRTDRLRGAKGEGGRDSVSHLRAMYRKVQTDTARSTRQRGECATGSRLRSKQCRS